MSICQEIKYDFTQTRVGLCKCGNMLKTEIHWQFQINEGLTYCDQCYTWTKTKYLEAAN